MHASASQGHPPLLIATPVEIEQKVKIMLPVMSSSLHSESPTAKSTSPCSNRSLNSIRPIIKTLLSPVLCSTARSLLNSNSLGGAQQLLILFLRSPVFHLAQQRTTNGELIELAWWQFCTDFINKFMLVITTTCTQKTNKPYRALQNGDALASVPIVNSIRK